MVDKISVCGYESNIPKLSPLPKDYCFIRDCAPSLIRYIGREKGIFEEDIEEFLRTREKSLK